MLCVWLKRIAGSDNRKFCNYKIPCCGAANFLGGSESLRSGNDSSQIGSAPAPGKKGGSGSIQPQFVTVSPEKVNY